ncbi:hypothetical protein B5G34_05840 [Flavonifractor sp. An82]|uniref:hypothetical protein n=1 Tax=Flavonifractor sp. An82 TaxID=1965660 RepID=UPI000B388A93|nr:hypothetical protein [Flavonifractor sp. An82]OUN22921.1 hypothetical protein B5G34_05840 [Flavonifractor sp. An82]
MYAIICCLLCLTMLFELNRRAKLTKEMEMVRMLWKEDSKQLAERKDTIELINMKCHDIRHKLEDYHLSLTNDEEKEIKSLIQIYDQTYRTGNQTRDVLDGKAKQILKNYALGRLIVAGDNRYLSGDLLDFLAFLVEDRIPDTKRQKNYYLAAMLDRFPSGSFYAPGAAYAHGDVCTLLRNPHIARNEELQLSFFDAKEERRQMRRHYFGHLTDVVMVSADMLAAERLDRACPETVPPQVLRTLVAYYIANRPEDSDWVVLPVMNFDCYFGDTKFGRKYLAMLPDEVIQRSSSFGVSRYRVREEYLPK